LLGFPSCPCFSPSCLCAPDFSCRCSLRPQRSPREISCRRFRAARLRQAPKAPGHKGTKNGNDKGTKEKPCLAFLRVLALHLRAFVLRGFPVASLRVLSVLRVRSAVAASALRVFDKRQKHRGTKALRTSTASAQRHSLAWPSLVSLLFPLVLWRCEPLTNKPPASYFQSNAVALRARGLPSPSTSSKAISTSRVFRSRNRSGVTRRPSSV